MSIRINHIAIVLPDLEEGAAFWVDALGIPVRAVKEVPEQQVRVAFLPVGESKIELLEPTDDASGVARYLARRGPGLHHICLEVDDIEGTLGRLRASGIQLIDETPRTSDDGTQLAFIHPKSTGGVLVELYQVASSPAEE